MYEDTNKIYLEITNNIEKKEKIVQLQQQIYEMINTIQIYIKQYNSSNNPALIDDAVKLYTEELIGKIKELNILNFAYKAVEYDLDSNTYTLVETPISVEQIEVNLGDNNIISFIVGLGKDSDKVGIVETKKKGRKTKAQLAEEEKDIEKIPDKFGPKVTKKTKTSKKVKNKTVKKQAVNFEIESDTDSNKSIEITINAPNKSMPNKPAPNKRVLKPNPPPVTINDINWGDSEDSNDTIEIEGKGVDKIDLGVIEELPDNVSTIYGDDLHDEDYNYNKNENNESDKIIGDPFDKIY